MSSVAHGLPVLRSCCAPALAGTLAEIMQRQSSSPLPLLTVRNRQRKIRLDLVQLNEAARKILVLVCRIPARASRLRDFEEIEVTLISDRRMADVHRRFLGQAGPTDVITFDHGEILVSVPTARRNARVLRSSLGHELRLYIAHGLLHLHGFDDRENHAARRMRQTQERILKALN